MAKQSIACPGFWWWHPLPLPMFWVPLSLKDKINCVEDLISPKASRVFSIINLFYNNGYFSKYFLCSCNDFFFPFGIFFSFETWKEKLSRVQSWLFANSVVLYLWQSEKKKGNGIERGGKPKLEKCNNSWFKHKIKPNHHEKKNNKSQTQKQEFMPFW